MTSFFICQLEPLCRELQATGHKGFLIFIDSSEITNHELVRLYETHFNLYLNDQVSFARTIFALIPKLGFLNTFAKHSDFDPNWELPPATNLKAKGKAETPTIISQLELEPFKFVVLTHRSFAYDSKKHQNLAFELNQSTNISSAEDAIKLISKRGLKIIRMGVDTDDLPDSLKLLPIIDLSGKFRTDAQDLWLSANCLFLWGINGVGTWHFAHKYNRPTLVTNNYAFSKGYQITLFTLQLIWDEKKNRFLKINEMASLRGVQKRVSNMKAHGLTYVENSASELVDYVTEMLDYVDNTNGYSDQDLSLLSQFDAALVKSGYSPTLKNHSQPCISFLRTHQDIIL